MKNIIIIKIYALKDPLTHKVMYVGKTKGALKLRLNQHIYCSVSGVTKKDIWIKKLNEKGMKPIIEIIETVTGDWQEREMYWIKYYNAMTEKNEKLTNGTVGGLGVRRGKRL